MSLKARIDRLFRQAKMEADYVSDEEADRLLEEEVRRRGVNEASDPETKDRVLREIEAEILAEMREMGL